MGMYDNVNFEMDCPICGKRIDDFQTKDGDCLLNTLSPCDVSTFYSGCRKCNSFINIQQIKDKHICTVSHYDKENKKNIIDKEFEIEVCPTIEIDVSLEEYFVLNEEARKQRILLDKFVENILKEAIEKEKKNE